MHSNRAFSAGWRGAGVWWPYRAGGGCTDLKHYLRNALFYSISGSNPASVAYKTATATTSVMSASMSENVVTIKENSASKLFELGYVPITVSMAMPANTTYQVTLSFTASGGSAVAFLEIYDFGSANYSNSLTFNMSDNATNSHATYTKLRAREDSKNTNFGGTYSTTVTFANTSASDKTISHYFGFFTGVHYGSKYDHTLTSTCTITAGKITDLDDIVPTVNASTSNLWHLIDGTSSAANNTQASSRFVQEKDSITQAEADLMGIPYRYSDYNEYWPMRASLTTGTNKLTIKNNGCTTLSCHMSYAPFSVPITVPAKYIKDAVTVICEFVERTYQLPLGLLYNLYFKHTTYFQIWFKFKCFGCNNLNLFFSNSISPSSRILQSSLDIALRSTDKKSASCWRLKGMVKFALFCFLACSDR